MRSFFLHFLALIWQGQFLLIAHDQKGISEHSSMNPRVQGLDINALDINESVTAHA